MNLTNKFSLPKPFENLIKGLVYDPRDKDPNRVSITTLINNPLPRILTCKYWAGEKVTCDCCNGTGEVKDK